MNLNLSRTSLCLSVAPFLGPNTTLPHLPRLNLTAQPFVIIAENERDQQRQWHDTIRRYDSAQQRAAVRSVWAEDNRRVISGLRDGYFTIPIVCGTAQHLPPTTATHPRNARSYNIKEAEKGSRTDGAQMKWRRFFTTMHVASFWFHLMRPINRLPRRCHTPFKRQGTFFEKLPKGDWMEWKTRRQCSASIQQSMP